MVELYEEIQPSFDSLCTYQNDVNIIHGGHTDPADLSEEILFD